MRLIKNLFVFVVLSISLFGIINADLEINNSHIDSQYGLGSTVRGWINISLSDVSANSIFEDSKGNTISLVDLLNINNNVVDLDDVCSTIKCVSDYTVSNPEEIKTLNLGTYDSRLIGFKFDSNINSIDNIGFEVSSDVENSCYNQLKLDFFNNGEIIFGNNKTTPSLNCDFLESRGCFDENAEIESSFFRDPTREFCQRIELSESPGFEIGAFIEDVSDGLKMTLRSINGEALRNCDIQDNLTGDVSCNINYLITNPEEYYVCIYSDNGNSVSEIKGYDANGSEACGFYTYQGDVITENSAWNIFAIGNRFDDFGVLDITNSLSEVDTLSGFMSDYIGENYGSFDCSNKDCVVPVNILSQEPQEITLSNLVIDYVTTAPRIESNFYELTETPASINSDYIVLSLDDANFSVSSSYGNSTFVLKFNGEEILSKKITIERVPEVKYLNPTTTASGYPQEFEVSVDGAANISLYDWDFGDDETETTNENKVIHTYNSTGTYALRVDITDVYDRKSFKIFSVVVESPEKIINTTLKEMQKDLDNVNKQIDELDEFTRNSLNSILGTGRDGEIDDELSRLQSKYSKAYGDEEILKEILEDLLELRKRLPVSISTTKTSDSLSFVSDRFDIDLDVLQVIREGDYDSEDKEKYLDSIIAWNIDNLDVLISHKEISAKFGDIQEPVLNVFEIKTSEKQEIDDYYYFVLSKLDDLEFEDEYSEESLTSHIYIELEEPENKIVFSTTEEIDNLELPLFISPEIDSLVIETGPTGDVGSDGSKWTLFIFILIFVSIIGVVVYVSMQIWYKRKYENYLFKNRNNLYNLVVYIQNERNKGVKDSEISHRLKKTGWSSEQVRYAMKKHAGKRTGMVELPVDKFIEKFSGIFKRKKPQQKKVNPYHTRSPYQRRF